MTTRSKIKIATDASCLKDNIKDGAGHTACAFIVVQGDNVIKDYSEYLGKRTISEAEYYGIIRAIEYVNKTEALHKVNVTIFSDSEFAVRQINGIYKVKAENIFPLYHRVKEIMPLNVTVKYHKRTQLMARLADALAGSKCTNHKAKCEINEQEYRMYRMDR